MLENAIRLEGELYMVPSGIDADGCETFTTYAPGRLTQPAVHYRQADGGFGIKKEPTVCRVRMVRTGGDALGCAAFRAEPEHPGLQPSPVTYYQDAEGAYTARRPRACP